jgi:hypothetical protein
VAHLIVEREVQEGIALAGVRRRSDIDLKFDFDFLVRVTISE